VHIKAGTEYKKISMITERNSLKTSKISKMHKKFMVDIKIFYIYIFACAI